MYYYILLLFVLPSLSEGIKCFECFDTGPTNKDCTKDKFCTGAACLIFEDGNNMTANAFCLLTTEHVSLNKVTPGCWLEPDGKGKHCVCFQDYCNKLRDRTQIDPSSNSPLSSPLASLTMLKHNPFLDYEYPDSDDDDNNNGRMHSRPVPSNVMFPAALEEDLNVAGEMDTDDDQDLVPIDFAEYTNGVGTDAVDRRSNEAAHYSLTTLIVSFLISYLRG
ncbi:hypothetical protein FO519_002279 [Halicephalobus sp. NKZ332]|nr:hypothetical protein FO519_002279 [Halicephalobus sp. NKZ332]